MLFSFTNEHVSSQNVSSSSCVRIRMNENEALHIIDVPTCFCRTCFNRAATAIQSSVKTHPPLALLRCSFGSIPCVAPWPCCHLTPIPVIWKKKKKYIKQVGSAHSAVPVLQTTLDTLWLKKKTPFACIVHAIDTIHIRYLRPYPWICPDYHVLRATDSSGLVTLHSVGQTKSTWNFGRIVECQLKTI